MDLQAPLTPSEIENAELRIENKALKDEIERLNAERKKTTEHLQNYRKAQRQNSDTIMVMVITEANNPTSNALWCADLHDLDWALDSVFTGGDPSGLFEDFWVEGSGVDIRFKRVSRKEFDEAMDEGNEWDGW